MRNGKGSRARSRKVSRAQYGDNFERIFGAGTDARKWGYSRAADARYWEPAESASRDDVVTEAVAHYRDGRFAICRCRPIDVAAYLPTGDDLCEQLAQTIYDNYGIEGDFPNVSGAACDELAELVQRWAAKHIRSDEVPWLAVDIEQLVITGGVARKAGMTLVVPEAQDG